jgi:hypothetical protein
MDRSGKAMRKAIAFAAAVVVALAATAAVVLPAEAQENGQCDPNYDPCVPIASDVDCLGGSGDGPEFVEGPVTVIGEDIYGLDDGGEPCSYHHTSKRRGSGRLTERSGPIGQDPARPVTHHHRRPLQHRGGSTSGDRRGVGGKVTATPHGHRSSPAACAARGRRSLAG